MIGLLRALFRLLAMWFSANSERGKERRKEKKEAFEMMADGIKEKDPSKITAGFDRLNR